MRVAVIPTLAFLSLGFAACDGQPLTGPEAQNAFARALAYLPAEHTDVVVPEGMIMFVNDRRVEVGESLPHLSPDVIKRIEVIKGAAAAKLYGNEARAGVIRIYTVQGGGTHPPE